MFSLETIVSMNNRAAQKALRPSETETSRHCSYSGNHATGIVLHSAKQRNTVFIQAGDEAGNFLKAWMATTNVAESDALVESYFA